MCSEKSDGIDDELRWGSSQGPAMTEIAMMPSTSGTPATAKSKNPKPAPPASA